MASALDESLEGGQQLGLGKEKAGLFGRRKEDRPVQMRLLAVKGTGVSIITEHRNWLPTCLLLLFCRFAKSPGGRTV